MSKHSLHIRPSAWPGRLVILLFATLIGSVWLWQPYIFTGQAWAQLGVSLFLLAAGWCIYPRGEKTQRLWLDEKGQIQWPEAVTEGQAGWQITSDSRVMLGIIWLTLRNPGTSRRRWLTLYKDSLSEADFRRICRQVRRIQSKEYEYE
nr:protein YgfX [Saliniradius amylolyticus]